MAKLAELNIKIIEKEESGEDKVAFENILVNPDVVSIVRAVKDSEFCLLKLLNGDTLICNEKYNDVKKKLK